MVSDETLGNRPNLAVHGLRGGDEHARILCVRGSPRPGADGSGIRRRDIDNGDEQHLRWLRAPCLCHPQSGCRQGRFPIVVARSLSHQRRGSTDITGMRRRRGAQALRPASVRFAAINQSVAGRN